MSCLAKQNMICHTSLLSHLYFYFIFGIHCRNCILNYSIIVGLEKRYWDEKSQSELSPLTSHSNLVLGASEKEALRDR